MTGVWVRFSEDTSLPPVLGADEKTLLEKIFSGVDPESPLQKAFRRLGLVLASQPMLKWEGENPLFNWQAVVAVLGGGWIEAAAPDAYRTNPTPLHLFRFLRTQWEISRYLARTLKAPLPENEEDQIVESLALGFAALMLTFSLPRHDQAQLAEWLARPEKLSARLRRTVLKLRAIQSRRTKLTPAWQHLFPGTEDAGTESKDASKPARTEWSGIGVSGYAVVGRLHLAESGAAGTISSSVDPVIFVFRRARPDSTTCFGKAAAVLYAEGGVMSHACTIAREENLTCVTALGVDFYEDIRALASQEEQVWLSVDGQTGRVGLVK